MRPRKLISLFGILLSCGVIASCSDSEQQVCSSEISAQVTPREQTLTNDSIEPVISPLRSPNLSWSDSLNRKFQSDELNARLTFSEEITPNSISMKEAWVLYTPSIDVSKLPEWPYGADQLLDAMKFARDERIYTQSSRPGFKRRALWLYAYNACFVRAAHVAQSMERQSLPRPGKVYAFGNLRVKSKFDPKGTVYWDYHVAPGYRLGEATYILDPGIEPNRLLLLEEWLSSISDDISQVRVAICETHSYSPLNPCWGGRLNQERSTINHLRSYLPDEWSRVARANWNPEKVLGDEPPWISSEPEAAPSPTPADNRAEENTDRSSQAPSTDGATGNLTAKCR